MGRALCLGTVGRSRDVTRVCLEGQGVGSLGHTIKGAVPENKRVQ